MEAFWSLRRASSEHSRIASSCAVDPKRPFEPEIREGVQAEEKATFRPSLQIRSRPGAEQVKIWLRTEYAKQQGVFEGEEEKLRLLECATCSI